VDLFKESHAWNHAAKRKPRATVEHPFGGHVMRASIPVLLALMIGCATGATVRDLVVPARAQNQLGPVFEYSTVKLFNYNKADIDNALTQYSTQGWRLSATHQQTDFAGYLIFEREKGR
jgi:hypothetical protein